MSASSYSPSALSELRSHAMALIARGDFAAGCVATEAACVALAATLGEDHESVAKMLEQAAGAARQAGDIFGARNYFLRARAIYRQSETGENAAGLVDSALRHLVPLHDDEVSRRPGLVLLHNGRQHVVRHDFFYIGRGIERSHLFIHSPMLSRIHARILWRRKIGAFVMEDCRSENGTYFQGKPLARDVFHTIADGDVFVMSPSTRPIEITCRVSARRA